MMEDITWLHIEPTTRCNAWCPFCPRNDHGVKLAEGLVLQDLPVECLEERIKQLEKEYPDTAVKFIKDDVELPFSMVSIGFNPTLVKILI